MHVLTHFVQKKTRIIYIYDLNCNMKTQRSNHYHVSDYRVNQISMHMAVELTGGPKKKERRLIARES
jgi:hypothetical protein